MKISSPNFSGSALVLAANVSLSLSDFSSRTQTGALAFHSNASTSTPTSKTGNIAIGSWLMRNGEWACCLSPFWTLIRWCGSCKAATALARFRVL